jgi:alpha-beta hydrolase superfamily lysophospholipase
VSAAPRFDAHLTRPRELAEAIYFDSEGHQLFGWLHRPAAHTAAETGLVVCNPFGYEAICSHRSVRVFAEAAAACGVPALRFDYVGTGDSAEIDPRSDQVEAWSSDVVSAVLELKRRTGVERVCVLGIRLGGLLAVLAAQKCSAITSLALVGPVVNGRRYLRELRMTRLASSLGAESSSASQRAGAENSVLDAGSMQVSGFTLAAQSLAALAGISLDASSIPSSVTEMLVIDGSRMPAARDWVELLGQSGARVKYLDLPGLVEMTMTSPQLASVPQEMIAALKGWLPTTLTPHSLSEKGQSGISADFAQKMILSLPSDGSGELSEHPIFFGTDALLFGIVTEPAKGERRRRAAILVNAGADYHIGASGIYVELARNWARRGYVAMRMDLAGLGDSSTRTGQRDDEVFPQGAIDDIRAAIDLMRNRYGACDITLAGFCSGAYHTLRAAVASMPVNRILMVNPQNFFWKKGMSINDMQEAELVSKPRLYRSRIFSASTWWRLLAGKVHVRYILKIYAHRLLLTVESTLRDCARFLHLRLPRDLGTELEQLGARGMRIVFVFARGEPGIDLLDLQGGSSIKRLGDSCRIHIVESADHVFSQNVPRRELCTILSDELTARTDWPAAVVGEAAPTTSLGAKV